MTANNKVQSDTLLTLKQSVIDCFAIISLAYNDTSVQPQTHAMGAARRDPRGGESPMTRCNQPWFMKLPFVLGTVVSEYSTTIKLI